MKSLLLVALLSVLLPFGSASAIGPASKLDIVVTAPGVPVDIRPLENDSDPDGDELRLSTFTQPQHGSIEETSPGVLRYTPREGYAGRDAFRYSASDGTTQSSQTVYVYVSTTGKPWPVISDSLGGYITPSSNLIYALSSNVDPDGNPLTIESFTQPAVGRVFLVGPGVFMYQNSGYWSTHVEFTYRVSNGSAISNTAKVIRIANQFGGPTAGTYAWGDSAIIAPDEPVDISVLSNDYDRQGWAVTLTGFAQPANGTVTEPSPGILRYVPKPGFIGQDQFGYSVKSHFATGATVRITVTDQTGPQMQDDTGKTAIGESVDLPVLANDFELRGGTIALVDFTQPAHGTVTQVGLGQVRYTPQPGFVGQDTFKYRATNGNGISEAAVQVDVLNRRRPVATEDAIVTPFRTPVTIPVLLNDVAPEGGSLVITEFIPPAKGTISLSSSGTISYSPRSDFAGEDRFSYIVSDGVLSAQGNVRVTVNPNGTPVAQADSVSTISAVPVLIYVLGNDYDPDNAALSIKAVGSPAHGTASVDYSQKLITYKSEAGFVGSDEFTYTVTDGVASAQGIVRVTIGVNHPPVAGDDEGFGTPGVERNIYIRDNDSDPESGGKLSAVLVTPPGHGAVSTFGYVGTEFKSLYGATGAWSYKADAGYEGPDEFTYKVFDGNSYSAPATVRITVRANIPPTAGDDYRYIPIGTTGEWYVGGLENDFDPDSDALVALRIVSTTEPAFGTVKISSGSLYYTPGVNYNGSDQFTYTVSDSQGATATASVTISAQSNAAPQLNDDSARLPADASFVAIPVLANDSDPDGDPLIISETFSAEYGVVVRAGNILIYHRNFDYFSFTGTKDFDEFSYAVSDGHGNRRVARVRVDLPVVVRNANKSPNALPDTVEVPDTAPVTINVLANDSDPDGDVLTITSVSGASKGMVVNGGSSVVYTRYESVSGADSFSYTISDGRGGGTTGTVTVRGGNSKPIARVDSVSLSKYDRTTIDVLANDEDPDGDVITISSVSTARKGSVVKNGNSIDYTPHAGMGGTDSFTYTIDDGHGGTATATVTVSLPGGNSRPVAKNDEALVVGQSPITINVLENDSDPDGDELFIDAVSTANKGVVLKSGSSLIYTPSAAMDGTDTFTYTIKDDRGGAATATVTVTITTAPRSVVMFATGDAVPGAGEPKSGIPASAVFQSFGIPSINDAGAIAFLGAFRAGSAISKGIFAGDPVLPIVQTGGIAPGMAGQLSESARFETIKDPLLNAAGDVAFVASLSGVPSGSNSGIWIKPHDGLLRQVVTIGQDAAGISGAVWKTITSVALTDAGTIPFVAKVEGGRTSRSTVGLWVATGTSVHLLLRHGDILDLGGTTKTVKDFVAMAPVPLSPGQGRLSENGVPVRVKWTDGAQSLFVFAPGTAPVLVSSSGDSAPDGGTFESFGFPTLNRSGQLGVLAKVKASVGARTNGLGKMGVFAQSPDGEFSLVVREGDPAPGPLARTARFKSFQTPVYNAQLRTAFVARIAGRDVLPSNNQGVWWTRPDGSLAWIGQTDIGPVDIGPGPTSAGWASFTSLALPDGPTAGPIFTAKVKTGGPRKASYSGLWAANSTGLARNVVRTGQTILVGGQGKVVRTFHVLEMVPGSPAQPRSYNGQKQLAYQVTFTDGTSAILQAQLY